VSRTEGVQDHEAGFRIRRIFKRIKHRYGSVPLSARIRALDFELLQLSEKMNAHTARSGGGIAPKLKELAQLKVAVMVGCPF